MLLIQRHWKQVIDHIKTNSKILDFHDDEDYSDETIMMRIRRLSDQKEFILELDNLKAIDKKSNNYQLFDDYAVWFVNY